MNLQEKRKSYQISQRQASEILGIPLRTYARYEEDESYSDSYKYKKIMEDLDKAFFVDEEHGLLTVEKIKTIVLPVLEEHNINFAYLFGSYATGEARENSDVDLLVDTSITGLAYFQLVEELRTKLRKKVDLLRLSDIEPDNPISIEILKNGIKIK